MIAKLKSRIDRLERALVRLRPSSSPNLLTSHTTRGVVRRPTKSANHTASSTDIVPRWG